jgi:hypothetical protein
MNRDHSTGDFPESLENIDRGEAVQAWMFPASREFRQNSRLTDPDPRR